MNENKKIVMIFIALILALFGTGLSGYIIAIKSEDKYKNETNNSHIEKDNTDKELEQKNFNILYQYGKDIYEKKLYISSKKDKNGVHYVSINDLDKLGYDVSTINKKCDREIPIIYFDIDFKLKDTYDKEPLLIFVKCNDN